jgi:FkbM family methyltransferase
MLDELSKQQYFDLEEFKSNEEEVFVDVGGFDGMTSIGFLDWCKNSKEKSIYVFEPDSDNIEKCHNNLSKYTDNYKIIDKGCWSTEDTLKFKAQGNGASSIDTTGENEVKVTTLDKELQDKKVTFIKMDIEGAEVEALKGAKNIIEKNKPKLAISIYHKPEDIWEIPKIIMQYCPEYRFWLRHYSLTSAETVLYAM